MTDFLLELRSEEIPARMQDKARDDLARLFAAELDKAGLKASAIVTYATPRRLALIARDLPLQTQPVSEETKGPKSSAPPQALEGFLRKTGLTHDQLVERDGVYFAVVEKPGRQTTDLLADVIPAIIRSFAWPKSMRWGQASASTESLRWVRPLQGIVALLGDDVVACEVDGIVSGSATMGHRFHHSGPVTIGNAGDYAAKLRACHVIVDQEERRAIIRAGAQKAADDAGLRLVADEGLVNENGGLTEWPVPMLGRFDPAFLAVPEEVIQLTARVNQKYFVCRDPAGALANAFVCTANIVANDGGAAIVAGNQKVLAARLSDAKFFWEQDLKIALDDQAKKLTNIVFHEKLGTLADKVDRVAKLARWLVESGVIVTPSQAGVAELADQAERAARLCKADLVTGMVGEFPELQGLIGGYYARAQGEGDAVADAVRDHYKPVGQGDDVPTAPVTVAVSLADKLDTIVGFFAIDEKPTGSKDPFALRRAVLGIIRIIQACGIRIELGNWFKTSLEAQLERMLRSMRDFDPNLGIADAISFEGAVELKQRELTVFVPIAGDVMNVLAWNAVLNYDPPELFKLAASLSASISLKMADLLDFFADRLKVQQKEAGVRHDLIDAVFALGGEDDLVRLLARVKALQGFVATTDGANLLAAYKRAANILKQAGDSPLPLRGGAGGGECPPEPSASTPHPNPSPEGEGLESLALLAALDSAAPRAAAAVEAEDFETAMAALASLRGPIDAFFEAVMVNDPDPHKREFRIGLLARFRDAVHRVADFGKIEG